MDHEKWLEQHDRMMADHHEAVARHDREMAELRESQKKTEAVLRRAIRIGVREARHERTQRQELGKELAQRQQDLSDYADKRHQELEALLRAFLERGGNGSTDGGTNPHSKQ